MARLTSSQMQRLLDDTMAENEQLRSEVERLEAEVYRRRNSERSARVSLLNPCEQVTLYMWAKLDKLSQSTVRTSWSQMDDFPAPVSSMLPRNAALYDLAALREWRTMHLARKAAHKEAALQQRYRDSDFAREFYSDEC